ncbi:MAG: hypothetical protein K0Q55_382 [Verrucomicrobia bacterium]|jgi:hypothetical protein|nr:hypothetical protein [Verrucomicrobiota bacterium]
MALLITVTAGTGCKTAYYATMEKFGVAKRDLLKKRVLAARDEQKEAGEQFKDALTKLQELYRFDGGKLEAAYRELEGEYKNSAALADSVHKRVKDMETVANDLFREWEAELAEITTPSLQAASRRQLLETRTRYDSMAVALKKAEQSMDPVLRQLKDHVLFLKHNLNAQAIASLKGEAASIQTEIGRLINDMNASIAKADEFIKTLEQP